MGVWRVRGISEMKAGVDGANRMADGKGDIGRTEWGNARRRDDNKGWWRLWITGTEGRKEEKRARRNGEKRGGV